MIPSGAVATDVDRVRDPLAVGTDHRILGRGDDLSRGSPGHRHFDELRLEALGTARVARLPFGRAYTTVEPSGVTATPVPGAASAIVRVTCPSTADSMTMLFALFGDDVTDANRSGRQPRRTLDLRRHRPRLLGPLLDGEASVGERHEQALATGVERERGHEARPAETGSDDVAGSVELDDVVCPPRICRRGGEEVTIRQERGSADVGAAWHLRRVRAAGEREITQRHQTAWSHVSPFAAEDQLARVLATTRRSPIFAG